MTVVWERKRDTDRQTEREGGRERERDREITLMLINGWQMVRWKRNMMMILVVFANDKKVSLRCLLPNRNPLVNFKNHLRFIPAHRKWFCFCFFCESPTILFYTQMRMGQNDQPKWSPLHIGWLKWKLITFESPLVQKWRDPCPETIYQFLFSSSRMRLPNTFSTDIDESSRYKIQW